MHKCSSIKRIAPVKKAEVKKECLRCFGESLLINPDWPPCSVSWPDPQLHALEGHSLLSHHKSSEQLVPDIFMVLGASTLAKPVLPAAVLQGEREKVYLPGKAKEFNKVLIWLPITFRSIYPPTPTSTINEKSKDKRQELTFHFPGRVEVLRGSRRFNPNAGALQTEPEAQLNQRCERQAPRPRIPPLLLPISFLLRSPLSRFSPPAFRPSPPCFSEPQSEPLKKLYFTVLCELVEVSKLREIWRRTFSLAMRSFRTWDRIFLPSRREPACFHHVPS